MSTGSRSGTGNGYRSAPRIWLTSDLHLGDERVAARRGFDTARAMDETLLELWSQRVAGHDTVWVLGDVARDFTVSEAVLARLPGRKHLVLGNQDSGHPMHSDPAEPSSRVRWRATAALYTRTVFRTVNDWGSLVLPGGRVVLYHLPFPGTFARGARLNHWRPRDLGTALVHGHEHDPNPERRLYTTAGGTPCFNVVPDANGWAPYDSDEVDVALSSHHRTRSERASLVRESLAASSIPDKAHRRGRGAARRRKNRLRRERDAGTD